MKSTVIALMVLVLSISSTYAQINEIKKESSSHAGGRGDRSYGSSSGYNGGGSGVILEFFFRAMFVDWQRYKLEKHEVNREITSLEVRLQGSVNPLNNSYSLDPRIRGSWGLYATDFRINYLIENSMEGLRHIRTNDWQILQLNIVTTKHVLFRVGGGVLTENFSDENTYVEWTAGLQLNSANHRIAGIAEYRGSEPRREASTFLRYSMVDVGKLHGYITAGVTYQRYYETIDIWGLQGGFICKLY